MSDETAKRSFRDSCGNLLATRKWVLVVTLLIIASVNVSGVFPPALGVPVTLVLIAVVAWLMRVKWADLGLSRPSHWGKAIAIGVGVGVVSQLVAGFALIPLFKKIGVEPADYSGFERTVGSLILYLVIAWTTAGVGEEVIYRGFLMGQLRRVIGDGKVAATLIVIVVSVVFGLGHMYQGTMGILLVTYSGLVFGVLYLAAGRNLWYTIIAHGTADTMAFLFVYTGLMDRFM